MMVTGTESVRVTLPVVVTGAAVVPAMLPRPVPAAPVPSVTAWETTMSLPSVFDRTMAPIGVVTLPEGAVSLIEAVTPVVPELRLI